MPESGFFFGTEPSSIDAGIYGFVANIYFYKIDTPLTEFVMSRPNLVRHCNALHAAVHDSGSSGSVGYGSLRVPRSTDLKQLVGARPHGAADATRLRPP